MDPTVVKRERREAKRAAKAALEAAREGEKEAWKEQASDSGRGSGKTREVVETEVGAKHGRSNPSGKGAARNEEWDADRDYEREREDWSHGGRGRSGGDGRDSAKRDAWKDAGRSSREADKDYPPRDGDSWNNYSKSDRKSGASRDDRRPEDWAQGGKSSEWGQGSKSSTRESEKHRDPAREPPRDRGTSDVAMRDAGPTREAEKDGWSADKGGWREIEPEPSREVWAQNKGNDRDPPAHTRDAPAYGRDAAGHGRDGANRQDTPKETWREGEYARESAREAKNEEWRESRKTKDAPKDDSKPGYDAPRESGKEEARDSDWKGAPRDGERVCAMDLERGKGWDREREWDKGKDWDRGREQDRSDRGFGRGHRRSRSAHRGEGYRGDPYRDPYRGERGDGYRGDGYRGEGYRGDGYRGEGYRGDSYRGEGYRGEGYRGDGYRGEGYRGEGYRGEGYRGEGYRGDGYRGEGYRGEGYRGEGYRGEPHRRSRSPHRPGPKDSFRDEPNRDAPRDQQKDQWKDDSAVRSRDRSRDRGPGTVAKDEKAPGAESQKPVAKAESAKNEGGLSQASPATQAQTKTPSSSTPSAPPTTGIVNAALIQQIQAQLRAANSPAAQQARKTARRLYVGNLPIGMVGITEVLTEFLNQAMLAAGLALTHINGVPLTGNPVLSVWLSAQQTFGFVEFRSEEETSAGMALNNIMFNGRNLRIARPADYVQATAVQGLNPIPGLSPQLAAAAGLLSTPGVAVALANQAAAAVAAATGATLPGAGSLLPPAPAQTPTRILSLQNMVTLSELDDELTVTEIEEDTREECAKFGEVLAVFIPRPHPPSEPSRPADEFVGKIFVAFDKPEAATAAHEKLHGRKFDGRSVVARYFEPAELEKIDYTGGFKENPNPA